MRDGPSSTRFAFGAAAILLGIFLMQGLIAARQKSPTFDETGDIASGLSYVQHLQVRANLQHPPLMKHLAGAALWLAGMRMDDSPSVRQMLSDRGGERAAGSEFLARSGVDTALMIARFPFLLCATGLGLVLFLWTRELAGNVAAVAALAVYALDPNVMAHGYLATMDMGLAAFAILFFYMLWRYLKAPGSRQLALCGIAMGLMLATKFSALLLVPVAAILFFLAMPLREALRSFLLCCAIAVLVVQALYLSPGGLFLYRTGLDRLNADHNPDYLVYLGGRLDHSFASYFAVAWLLKEPLVTLLLGGAGLFALRSQEFSRNTRLFLLLPPAAILLGHMLFADDLGIRYILPAFPFAHMIAGIGVTSLLSLRWGRPVMAVLAVWLVAAAIAVWPDQLSYFNEIAGGTRNGVQWLDDSNVDWGQDLPQLREWLNAHAAGRPVKVAYFGSYPAQQYLPGAQMIGIDELQREPEPGLYAVSAHLVARVPAISESSGKSGGMWLRRVSPTAIVGHAIYVYDVGAPRR